MQNASTPEYVFLPPPKRQFLLATDVAAVAAAASAHGKIYDSAKRRARNEYCPRTYARAILSRFPASFRAPPVAKPAARFNATETYSISPDLPSKARQKNRSSLQNFPRRSSERSLGRNLRILGIFNASRKERMRKCVKTLEIHSTCKKITL